LFVSEAHDDRWRATQSGRRLANVTAFGWANGYALERGSARVQFVGGPRRALALVVQLGAWLALGALLVGGRWRRRRGRRAERMTRAVVAEPEPTENAALVTAGAGALGERASGSVIP
jgi:hypothetical protein